MFEQSEGFGNPGGRRDNRFDQGLLLLNLYQALLHLQVKNKEEIINDIKKKLFGNCNVDYHDFHNVHVRRKIKLFCKQ